MSDVIGVLRRLIVDMPLPVRVTDAMKIAADELDHLHQQRDALQKRGSELVIDNQRRRTDQLIKEELHREIRRLVDRVVLVERVALKLWWASEDATLTEDECHVVEAIGNPHPGAHLGVYRDIHDMVRAFHQKFGYAVRDVPAVPADEEVRLRLKLIAEEFFELLDAALGQGIEPSSDAVTKVHNRIESAKVHVDLAELAHEMADLDYVVEGTRLTFGIDGHPVLCEVQRANMSKTHSSLAAADAAKVAGGMTKPQKPDGWAPPDVENVLKKQWWDGTGSTQ